MKKMKMAAIFGMAAITAMSMGTAAIAEEKETEEEGYVFEAEYTELEGLEGLGVSGSPSGLGLVAESADASNEFYLGNLGVDSPITFVITADQDTTAELKITVGSNILGSCKWDPESYIITVNGEELEYEEFATENGMDMNNQQNFKEVEIGEIELKEGENEIVFVAGENTYRANMPSAPSLDCIRLITDAELSMEELVENIE